MHVRWAAHWHGPPPPRRKNKQNQKLFAPPLPQPVHFPSDMHPLKLDMLNRQVQTQTGMQHCRELSMCIQTMCNKGFLLPMLQLVC